MSPADPALVIPPACGRCAVCKTRLVRAESGWACPRDLGHVRILADAHVLGQVRKQLPRNRPANMTPHQWGWYRARRAEWARRVVREMIRQQSRSYP